MMKKTIYIAVLMTLIASLWSCQESSLETNPTNMVSREMIFSTPDAAQVAVNGIYRALFNNGWSDGWSHENPGMMTLTLVKDLHGEDHLMSAQGQGWFFFDYAYSVDSDFTGTNGRQYAMWKLNYTLIAQANFIIAEEESLKAMGKEGANVVAQAYTLRAFGYMSLYEWFCKGNYSKSKDAPGVPIYTQPTDRETQGAPRGTVAQVFEQINADFTKAISLFKEADIKQSHPSHLDIYATYALRARAAQIQDDWTKAEEYANNALAKPGLKRVATIGEMGNFNDCKLPNIFWGFEVIADQTSPFGAYLSHMDPEGGYGNRAKQCIDAWLWSQIPDTDMRKRTWWEDPENFQFFAYNQMKFRYSSISTFIGDILYLRAEEMILIAAEAACRTGKYEAARNLLMELGSNRDSEYEKRLATYTNSSIYNTDTHGELTTLMDEILFQRRIELWSEGFGRAFDLRRLSLGFNRDYEGSNQTVKRTLAPDDNRYMTLLPQKEFDSNLSLTVADQNPR